MHGTDKAGRQSFVRKCRRKRDHLGDKDVDGLTFKGMQTVQVSVDRASLVYVAASYGPIRIPPNSKCARNFMRFKPTSANDVMLIYYNINIVTFLRVRTPFMAAFTEVL